MQLTRLTAWEMVHQPLVRALEAGGESAAAKLVAKLGSKAEVARELAYRLYTLCVRKKRAAEALLELLSALIKSVNRMSRLGGQNEVSNIANNIVQANPKRSLGSNFRSGPG